MASSDIKPIFVGYDFAALDIAPQESQVHRPAITGHAVVLVHLGPAYMMKVHLSPLIISFEQKAQPCSQPVLISTDNFQFKFAISNAARNNCSPIVLWSKPKLELLTLLGAAR